MANKVDVFTEELSKVFTILQQQYVMIKYMKTLITSGELDETEISKLKEQVTLINNQIQHINEKMGIIENNITDTNSKINTINSNIHSIENALARHTGEIDNNIATINALNNVMPTDINVDSNGNLILEHDGQEITGQKKQVAVYTKSQINTLLNSAGLKTFTLKNKDDYNYQSSASQNIIITTTDIPILNDCAEYVQEHGACILEFDYINRDITYDSPIRILMLYTINGGYGHIVLHGTTGDDEVNVSATRNEGAIADENKMIMNRYAYKSNIKDYKVYRHDLLINNVIHISFYSSNILNVDSVQDLTNIVKPQTNKQYICGTYDSEVGLLYAMLIYENKVWKYIVQGSGTAVNITTISDSVTNV